MRELAVDYLDPEPVSASAHVEAGAGLKRTLHAWCGQRKLGAAALAESDVEGMERALEFREALRPRIEELIGRLHHGSGASRELIASVLELALEAAAEDVQLTDAIQAEHAQLRQEIATLEREIGALRRGDGPFAAYRRPGALNPHRLNIVR
jgi:cell division protein FtsB